MIKNAEYKPPFWYIKLINVAKTQLNIEEESYRAILKHKTGKDSLKVMTVPELFTVLEHMKTLGFKVVSNKKKAQPKKETTMLDKLRQVWKQMHYHGFIKDSSDKALQTWATGQSKRLNNGVVIAKLEWLNGQMLYNLIEQLKQWHMRLLRGVFDDKYSQLVKLHKEGKLTSAEIEDIRNINERLNQALLTHQIKAAAYSIYIDILKNHNVTVGK